MLKGLNIPACNECTILCIHCVIMSFGLTIILPAQYFSMKLRLREVTHWFRILQLSLAPFSAWTRVTRVRFLVREEVLSAFVEIIPGSPRKGWSPPHHVSPCSSRCQSPWLTFRAWSLRVSQGDCWQASGALFLETERRVKEAYCVASEWRIPHLEQEFTWFLTEEKRALARENNADHSQDFHLTLKPSDQPG